jgi:hypothetical protein
VNAGAPRREQQRWGALGRLWRGEMPLADALWTWTIGIGFLINGGTSALCYALILNDRPIAGLVVGAFPSVPFNLIAGVGVWRSARRDDADPALATFARIVIIPVVTVFTLT